MSKSDPTPEGSELGGYSIYSPPHSPHYAMNKLATESVVRFPARNLGLPTIIARLDVACGNSRHGGAPMGLYAMMKNGHDVYSRRALELPKRRICEKRGQRKGRLGAEVRRGP